jgi:UDP-2,4-diacetamido-2,4,6-trideoxy-beta-L-altropyranose hydrolase
VTIAATLAIRVEADGAAGLGHFTRCFALAQAWSEQGGQVCFVTGTTVSAISERLESAGFELRAHGQSPGSPEDADSTAIIVRSLKAAWVVIDGYVFDARYQDALRNRDTRVLVLDDDGRAQEYSADLVLNQNQHASPDLYARRASHTRLLLGPTFVLLRREFRARIGTERQPNEPRNRILVTMGGSDPLSATDIAIDALQLLDVDALDVRIVIGSANVRAPELIARIDRGSDRWRALPAPPDMVPHMEWADLAICTAGSTVWELLFMGTPLVVGAASDVEERVVSSIAHHPAVIPAGRFGQVEPGNLAQLVTKALAQTTPAQRCGEWLVDGRGCERVLAAMQKAA